MRGTGSNSGVPDRSRTCGLVLRRDALYPAELRRLEAELSQENYPEWPFAPVLPTLSGRVRPPIGGNPAAARRGQARIIGGLSTENPHVDQPV